MSNFSALGVSKEFVQSLNEMGITKPSEIQEKAIPVLLQNKRDFIGQAQTGTGKTAAFGLPLLQNINSNKAEIQGLILCPTRELAMQISKQLFKFTKYCTTKIFTETVYGGEKIDIQIGKLKRPTHIVVATPGRLIDLLNRKALSISSVKTIVLDEADEMLSMGFKEQLDDVLKRIHMQANTHLFSATIPLEIEKIISKYMSNDALRIKVGEKNAVNASIRHQYAICEDHQKLDFLESFLKSRKKGRGIIFTKTKAAAIQLVKQLIAKNYAADTLHGDLTQKERDKAMRAFKNETIQYLIATDISARGIDVSDLEFVVHYQLPDQLEYYTHRSGRTGRAGKKGLSLALVHPKEVKRLSVIASQLKFTIDRIS